MTKSITVARPVSMPTVVKPDAEAKDGDGSRLRAAERFHLNSPVIFDDIDFRSRPDDPAAAGPDAAGVAAYALDPEAAERLWAVSEQMNQ